VAAIAPGRDTRDTVLVALGTPTAIGTFHVNSWYYIGAQTKTVAYRAPEVLGQQVVAILFTDDGVVEDVQRYTLADAMRVSPTARETPTRGREMGLMEQLIGNIGRFNPGAMRQTQQ
jgi:outer membrane protein assembly factor BamE (lipoprotein component of BamABCDE complex)